MNDRKNDRKNRNSLGRVVNRRKKGTGNQQLAHWVTDINVCRIIKKETSYSYWFSWHMLAGISVKRFPPRFNSTRVDSSSTDNGKLLRLLYDRFRLWSWSNLHN